MAYVKLSWDSLEASSFSALFGKPKRQFYALMYSDDGQFFVELQYTQTSLLASSPIKEVSMQYKQLFVID